MKPLPVPEVASCVVCGVLANTTELSCSAFPDGQYRWVCRDFHPCARTLAAAEDLRVRGRLGDDLDPAHGAGASARHLAMRAARMRTIGR